MQRFGDAGRERAVRAALARSLGHDRQIEEDDYHGFTLRVLDLADPSRKLIQRVVSDLISQAQRPPTNARENLEWSISFWLRFATLRRHRRDADWTTIAHRLFEAMPHNRESLHYLRRFDYERIELWAKAKLALIDPDMLEMALEEFEQWRPDGTEEEARASVEALRTLATTRPALARLFEARDAHHARIESLDPEPDRQRPTPAQELEVLLAHGGFTASNALIHLLKRGQWSRVLDRAVEVANDGTPGHFSALIGALQSCQLREPPPQLVALTHHATWHVRCTVCRVLSRMNHPSLRDLAIRAVREWPSTHLASGSMKLFAHTAKCGDELVVLRGCQRLEGKFAHAAWLDARWVIDEQPAMSWGRVLEWGWDNTPCSHCREGILQSLVKRGNVSQEIMDEARFDANRAVRQLARKYQASN